jgi:prepilin-type N-terminal cleavage/methylation domain-containing protein
MIRHHLSSFKQIGFTLVELLVSLGVLGLIATLTLPQLYIRPYTVSFLK